MVVVFATGVAGWEGGVPIVEGMIELSWLIGHPGNQQRIPFDKLS